MWVLLCKKKNPLGISNFYANVGRQIPQRQNTLKAEIFYFRMCLNFISWGYFMFEMSGMIKGLFIYQIRQYFKGETIWAFKQMHEFSDWGLVRILILQGSGLK
eukprot:TRINITY_DN65664_c0_g1_i1.p3 TRINITY_DN65664_c0_g1~~TRINITY_DN65664_c0_g1_i1.p3  ORF type:complete len:103 (+),score=1.03 TRINITY_DN65664_c0_g1_i1:58-366(+)